MKSAVVLVAALRFVVFTFPCHPTKVGSWCEADLAKPVYQYTDARLYVSPDSTWSWIRWRHIASWGAAGKHCGDSLKVLATWPDSGAGPLWEFATVRSPGGESCQSNIVRVR